MNATLTPDDMEAIAAMITTNKKKLSAEFLETWAKALAEHEATGANIILSKQG